MSYILDALRRSEQERRRLEPTGAVAAPDPAGTVGHRWLPVALTVALALNAAALGWLLLRAPASDAPSDTPTAASDPAPVAAVAPAAAVPVGPAASETAAPTTPAPARAPAAPASQPAAFADGRVMAALEPEPPLLEHLPDEFRRGVPPLGVAVHVYADNPSARWVLADGRRYGEGQELPGGVRLERITPDGMVLLFRGQRFALRVR